MDVFYVYSLCHKKVTVHPRSVSTSDDNLKIFIAFGQLQSDTSILTSTTLVNMGYGKVYEVYYGNKNSK